jgi:hypothetical protein
LTLGVKLGQLGKRDNLAIKHKMTNVKVKYANDPLRDQKITKVCANCGEKYHPRKNSYQIISRFCSQACARRGHKLNI